MADRDAGLVILSVPGDHPAPDPDGLIAFLDSTQPIDADGELWDRLELTDGVRTWREDDLNAVVTADDSDPTWLRLQAAINAMGRLSADDPTVRQPPVGQ